MTTSLEHLRLRFTDVLRQSGAAFPDETGALFRDLVSRYEEAHRRYHTLAHIEACLTWLERNPGLAQHPAEVALAIWFHDVIYDPRASDNEAQSAAYARSRLASLGLSSEAIGRIEVHILATQAHVAEHPDSRLVVDIDLTILGSPPEVFEAFERAIRQEYAHVPDALFQIGRREVLTTFLERPAIFRHPPFYDQLEAPARTNLGRRIRDLSTTEPLAPIDPTLRS